MGLRPIAGELAAFCEEILANPDPFAERLKPLTEEERRYVREYAERRGFGGILAMDPLDELRPRYEQLRDALRALRKKA